MTRLPPDNHEWDPRRVWAAERRIRHERRPSVICFLPPGLRLSPEKEREHRVRQLRVEIAECTKAFGPDSTRVQRLREELERLG